MPPREVEQTFSSSLSSRQQMMTSQNQYEGINQSQQSHSRQKISPPHEKSSRNETTKSIDSTEPQYDSLKSQAMEQLILDSNTDLDDDKQIRNDNSFEQLPTEDDGGEDDVDTQAQIIPGLSLSDNDEQHVLKSCY
jgi:hypothetical protein